MVGRTSWNDEEKAILTEKWAICHTVKEVASFLPNRTPNAVAQKALELGLGKLLNAKRPTSVNLVVILAALKDRGPMQYREICAYTRIPARSVLGLLKEAHERGEVHISDWGSNAISGYWPRIWGAGPGKDAPRPIPITHKEARARREEKIKKSPEMQLRRSIVKKARYWDKKRAQGVVNSIFSGV